MILRLLFRVARVLVGLGGLALMLHGLILLHLSREAFTLVLASAGGIELLFGFCLSYGAFRRFPWETRPTSAQPQPNERWS